MSEAKRDTWGNTPEDYERIVVEKARIPKGAKLVEAYLTKNCVVICGDPEPDDESHSCDAMGCSSVNHVTHRFWLDPWIPVGETPNTLPPHGQRVLFRWVNGMGKGRTSLGILFHMPAPYDPEYHDGLAEDYDEETGMYYTPPGWYEAGWGENPLEPPDGTVTHWMPLPGGPGSDEGEAQDSRSHRLTLPPRLPEIPEPAYGYSLNEEEFYGEHATREEALVEAMPDAIESDSEFVWTGRAVSREELLHQVASFIGEDVLERLNTWWYDQCGGPDDYPIELIQDVSPGELGFIIADWVHQNAHIDRWAVADVQEHKVDPDDQEQG